MPSFTGSVTDGATLVAAPNTGQFIRVLGGDLSAVSAVGEVKLLSNSTVIWDSEALNASPFSVVLNVNGQRTIDCVPGDPLKVAVGSGTVKVNLEYAIYGLPNPS